MGFKDRKKQCNFYREGYYVSPNVLTICCDEPCMLFLFVNKHVKISNDGKYVTFKGI